MHSAFAVGQLTKSSQPPVVIVPCAYRDAVGGPDDLYGGVLLQVVSENIQFFLISFMMILLRFIPKRACKRPRLHDGASVIHIVPIVQALAPYLSAGCCAVIGLVPHALFMVCKSIVS